MLNIVINFLLVIEVLVSLLIVLLVLMQRPKSEGLGAAFGGGMTENLFGAQTTNVLQKTTRWLGGMFFVVALVLSMLYSKQTSGTNQSIIQKNLANAPVPKPEQTPAPGSSAADQKAFQDLLEQKIKAAIAAKGVSGTNAAAISVTTGTGAAPAHAKTGESTAPADIEAPKLQLGIPVTGTGASTDDLQAPKLQLQTGTAANKKVGF